MRPRRGGYEQCTERRITRIDSNWVVAGQLPENYSDLDRHSRFLTFVVNSEGEAERRRRETERRREIVWRISIDYIYRFVYSFFDFMLL